MGRRNSRKLGKQLRSHRKPTTSISGRCPHDNKTNFRRYDTAAGHAFGRDDDGGLYWCAAAGAWHVSREDATEHAKRVAAHAPAKEAPMRVHPYQPSDLPPDHRGNRPCICGRAKANAMHDPEENALQQAAHAAEQAQHRARIADND